jgi:hypothetical protein
MVVCLLRNRMYLRAIDEIEARQSKPLHKTLDLFLVFKQWVIDFKLPMTPEYSIVVDVSFSGFQPSLE